MITIIANAAIAIIVVVMYLIATSKGVFVFKVAMIKSWIQSCVPINWRRAKY